MIERLPRTRLLARDLDRLVESAGPDGLQGTTICMIAGLGSLAISDHEPPDPVHGLDYKEALLAERNNLRTALVSGARLKALLHPPRRFANAMLPERLRVRYRRMIGLLEGRSDINGNPAAAAADMAAMNRCEFALTPVPPHNILIIGETVAYEGMKRGGTHGYEMTHCETSAEGLRELIQQFDQFFEASRNEMVRSHPPDGRLLEQLRAFLREAEENS
jgi:hypothetical protein